MTTQIRITLDDGDFTVNNEMEVTLDYTNTTGLVGSYSGKLFLDTTGLPVDVSAGEAPPATPPPALISLAAWPSGNGVTATYSLNVTADTYETFTVTRTRPDIGTDVDDSANWVWSAGNSPNLIKGVPTTSVNSRDVITVSLSNTGDIRSSSTDEPVDDFTDEPVNVSLAPIAPPEVDSIVAASTGVSIRVTFDENVTLGTSSATVTVEGTEYAGTVAQDAGADTVTVYFDGVQILTTDTVTLDLDGSGITNSGGTALVSLADEEVDVTGAVEFEETDFTGETPPGSITSRDSNGGTLTYAFVADTNSPSGSDIVVRAVQAVDVTTRGEADLVSLIPAENQPFEILALVRKTPTYAYAGISATGASVGLNSGEIQVLVYQDVTEEYLRVTGLKVAAIQDIALPFTIDSAYVWINLKFDGTNIQVWAWEQGTGKPVSPIYDVPRDGDVAPQHLSFFSQIKLSSEQTSECCYFAAKVGNTGIEVPVWGREQSSRYTYEPLEDYYSDNLMVHPQISTGTGTSGSTTAAINSCYDVFVSKDDTELLAAGAIKALSPDVTVIRYLSGIAYQGYSQGDQSLPNPSIPFTSTGATTDGEGQFFAGHWSYKAYQLTTQALTASATTVYVATSAPFVVGEYICIYDDTSGPFSNAEHCLITGKPTSTRLNISRGFKSTALTHGVGSKVAAHHRGQGTDYRLWQWNMSTICPVDGNGARFWQVYADWLGSYWNVCGDWETASAIDGIRYDADSYWLKELGITEVSTANSASADFGFVGGVNVWGEGMDAFYARCRDNLPGAILSGGSEHARGWGDLNGLENEGYPSAWPEAMEIDWDYVPGALSGMRLRRANDPAPHCSQGIFKRPTAVYPQSTDSGLVYAPDNHTLRVSLAACVMTDAAFATHRLKIQAPNSHIWFDEFAVDVDSESETFGQAFDKDDYASIRANKNWLGLPLGAAYRIYDESMSDDAAVYKADFSAGVDGWTSTNCTLSVDNGALKASAQIVVGSDYFTTNIKKANIPAVAGTWYTICAKMRAGIFRKVRPAYWNQTWGTPAVIGTDATWHIWSQQGPATKNYAHLIQLGRFNSEVWLEQFLVLEGQADVHCREFTNGIVYVNYGPDDKQVSLPGAYQRILGTQDAINNGEILGSTVTVPAHDALFLVKSL